MMPGISKSKLVYLKQCLKLDQSARVQKFLRGGTYFNFVVHTDRQRLPLCFSRQLNPDAFKSSSYRRPTQKKTKIKT